MLTFLADATTQPADTWVWSNISPEKLGLWIAIWGATITAAVLAIGKLGTLIIQTVFGWKKTVKEQLAELQKNQAAIAKNLPATNAEPTPEDVAKVNEIANTPPPTP